MYIKIYILLFLALLSVSTSPIIARFIDVDGTAIAFWRMCFASIILWTFSLFKKYIHFQSNNNYKKTIFAGFLLGIHFALFFSAMDYTSIAHATFLGTLAPFFTLVIEIFVLKRKFNKNILFGLFLVLLGSLIIVLNNFDISNNQTSGNIMAILCSICLAISFLIAENVRKKESTLIYTRTLYLSASITLIPILIFMAYYINPNNVAAILYQFTKTDYMGLLFLGIIPTLIGHNSIYYAVKYISPSIASSFPLGEPVIATIFAYYLGSIGYDKFINEISIDSSIYIGGLLTLSGLVLITLNRNK